MCLWLYENVICRLFSPVTSSTFLKCMFMEDTRCCYRQREWVYMPEYES